MKHRKDATMTKQKRMRQYVVYRHGANAANQGMALKRAVALVEAESPEQACETDVAMPGMLSVTRYLVRAPRVHAYHNQHFTARPVSRASKRDIEALEEGCS